MPQGQLLACASGGPPPPPPSPPLTSSIAGWYCSCSSSAASQRTGVSMLSGSWGAGTVRADEGSEGTRAAEACDARTSGRHPTLLRAARPCPPLSRRIPPPPPHTHTHTTHTHTHTCCTPHLLYVAPDRAAARLAPLPQQQHPHLDEPGALLVESCRRGGDVEGGKVEWGRGTYRVPGCSKLGIPAAEKVPCPPSTAQQPGPVSTGVSVSAGFVWLHCTNMKHCSALASPPASTYSGQGQRSLGATTRAAPRGTVTKTCSGSARDAHRYTSNVSLDCRHAKRALPAGLPLARCS